MMTVSGNGSIDRLLCTCVLILYVVLWQVLTVNCQTYNPNGTLKSMLPFCVDLPNTLRSGEIIKIMGSFDQTTEAEMPPWLDVVFRSGCRSTESPFFLKIRFDNRKLIRNSFQNGNWGSQESDGQFPFSLGAPFVLLIEVQPHGFKVTGNGVELWTFPNRLNSAAVSVLQATSSSANIRRVELVYKADQNQPGRSQIIYPVPLVSQPVVHPSFPFWGYFPDGLQVGKAIRITGMFPTDQERTSINLCADCFKGPILLHLDLRFRFYIYRNTAARAIYVNGTWQNNVEIDGPFPFRLQEPFIILIKVQPDSYNQETAQSFAPNFGALVQTRRCQEAAVPGKKISVNGVPCWTFAHRLPFTQVTTMTIERGPMAIWEIQYIDEVTDNEVSSTIVTDSPPTRTKSAVSGDPSSVLPTYYTTAYIILFVSLTCFSGIM